MSQKKQWWNLKKFQHHQLKGSKDKFSGIRIFHSSKILLKILCSGTKILQFLGYKLLLLLGKKFPLPLIGYSKPSISQQKPLLLFYNSIKFHLLFYSNSATIFLHDR